MMAYVLTVVLWFQGGMVGTKAISAPSIELCEAAKPAIVEQLRKEELVMAGHHFRVTNIMGRCDSYAVPKEITNDRYTEADTAAAERRSTVEEAQRPTHQ